MTDTTENRPQDHAEDARNAPAIPDGRDTRGRFAKGNSGKPPGARARATRAAEALLVGEAGAISRVLVDKALQGDAVALRLAVERLIPVRREHHVSADLPPLTGAADAVPFISGLLREIGAGRITVGEAERLAKLAGEVARIAELSEFDERLRKLEDAANVSN